MKFKLYFVILLLVLSCTSDTNRPDCALVLCAPNDPIQLEIIQDGMNILASGTITTENVTVESSSTEEVRHVVYNDTEGSVEALLTLNQFGLVEGSYTYSIDIKSSLAFDIQVDLILSEPVPCCGQRLLIQKVSSNEVIISERSGYYRVRSD